MTLTFQKTTGISNRITVDTKICSTYFFQASNNSIHNHLSTTPPPSVLPPPLPLLVLPPPSLQARVLCCSQWVLEMTVLTLRTRRSTSATTSRGSVYIYRGGFFLFRLNLFSNSYHIYLIFRELYFNIRVFSAQAVRCLPGGDGTRLKWKERSRNFLMKRSIILISWN